MVSLPKFRRSDADEREEYDPQGMPQQEAPMSHGQDVLAVMGIRLQTDLEPGILSPSEIKSAQFRARRPEGYNYDDVDTWHQQVTRAVDWYVSKLHQRDLDVHRLATEIDKNITDLTNLRYDLELAGGASSMPHADPALQVEIRKRDEHIAHLEQALEQAQEAASLDFAPQTGAGLTDDERQQFTELQEWAEAAERSYVELEERVAQLEQANAELEQQKAELEAQNAALEDKNTQTLEYANQMEQYSNQLEEALAANQTAPAQSRSENDTEYYAEPAIPAQTAEEQYPQPAYSEPESTSSDQYDAYEVDEVAAPQQSGPQIVIDPRSQEDLVDDFIEDTRNNRYAPELPAGVVLPSQRKPREEASDQKINPSSPLRSIPPGADPNDYL